MGSMPDVPPDRAGPCLCTHPYHMPRRPDVGPIGHPRGMEVRTLRNSERAVGVVPLCAVCRAAQHMRGDA
jgi:hypothetical protein